MGGIIDRRKHIEVVAGVIMKGSLVLATRRGYGEWKGWWEFPGGKIEPEESREEALERELCEELGIGVNVEKLIDTVDYSYPDFDITLHFFLCSPGIEPLTLREHEAARWLDYNNLEKLKWLPADISIVKLIAELSRQRAHDCK